MNKVIIVVLFFFVLFCVFFYEFKNESFDKDKQYEIREIHPKNVLNPDAKIAFVYFYTPNIYDYCQHSIHNISTY